MKQDDTAPQPKKKYKRKPTSRMIKTAEIMAVNGGKAAPAMREAGYSNEIARNPQKITRSEAFMSILDGLGVTDNKLGEVLNDGLSATKTVIIGSGEDAFADQVDDHGVRHRYLETALRLRGLGKSEGISVTFNNMVTTQREDYKL